MADSVVDTRRAPRCPKCGYLLVGLPELRCPECGQRIDPAFLEMGALRDRLLPWERLEMGGPTRRLARTLVGAFFHPARYWTRIAERKDYPIARAGRFIIACVGAALVLHVVAFIADGALEFLRLYSGRADARAAWDMTIQSTRITWWIVAVFSFIQLGVLTLWLLTVALLIRRLFRFRLGGVSTVELIAALGPVVALGASIWIAAALVVGAFTGLSMAAAIALFAQAALLFLHLWHCSRRMLALGPRKAIGMELLGVAVLFIAGVTMETVLDLFNLVV